MRLNKHSTLVGKHAFLSASNYHWTNYDEDKLDASYIRAMAAQRGTELHEFAAEAIRLGIRLPDNGQTLSLYVNDSIDDELSPEQVVYFSRNCFGTADCLGFRDGLLKIYDLKTGSSPASFRQLEVYASIFCLEYEIHPMDIQVDLRLYQNDSVNVLVGDGDALTHIMDKIVVFDNRIESLREGQA